MNTNKQRFLIKSGHFLKVTNKILHPEIFSPIGFGCRYASGMNCDTLGWSGWTGILWWFWSF